MTRTIDRGANPFAPIAKQRNQALTTPVNGPYERLDDRVATMMSDPEQAELVNNAISSLRNRLNGESHTATTKEKKAVCIEECDAGLKPCLRKLVHNRPYSTAQATAKADCKCDAEAEEDA